jgi:hypothetical protein
MARSACMGCGRRPLCGKKSIYVIVVRNCPGWTTCITPPKLHISLDLLFRAGMFPNNTLGQPGAQGAVVTGRQGMGVNTPKAAAVAAATRGLAMDEHIPKGRIFNMGLLSWMVAMGMEQVNTRCVGKTANIDGAAPKLHFNVAPQQTAKAIIRLLICLLTYCFPRLCLRFLLIFSSSDDEEDEEDEEEEDDEEDELPFFLSIFFLFLWGGSFNSSISEPKDSSPDLLCSASIFLILSLPPFSAPGNSFGLVNSFLKLLPDINLLLIALVFFGVNDFSNLSIAPNANIWLIFAIGATG